MSVTLYLLWSATLCGILHRLGAHYHADVQLVSGRVRFLTIADRLSRFGNFFQRTHAVFISRNYTKKTSTNGLKLHLHRGAVEHTRRIVRSCLHGAAALFNQQAWHAAWPSAIKLTFLAKFGIGFAAVCEVFRRNMEAASDCRME